MKTILKRFVWATADRKVNPLIYPFIFCVFVYGVGFLFLGDWTGVNSSSLYQSFYGVHTTLPAIWGAAGMVAGGSAIALIAARRNALGDTAALFGCLVWGYAAIMYAINGYWLVLFTVALVNLSFWIWYFFRLAWYKREKKSGSIVDFL